MVPHVEVPQSPLPVFGLEALPVAKRNPRLPLHRYYRQLLHIVGQALGFPSIPRGPQICGGLCPKCVYICLDPLRSLDMYPNLQLGRRSILGNGSADVVLSLSMIEATMV